MQRTKSVYDTARGNLIFMVILSAVNVALALTGSNTSFLFSDYGSYIMALLGRIYCDVLEGGSAYLVVFGAIAAVMLVPYLLCWIFSKKRRGWLIAALVLFAADTVWLLIDTVSSFYVGILLNLVFHVWVLIYLYLGVKNGAPAETERSADPWDRAPEEHFYDASMGTPAALDSGAEVIRSGDAALPDSRPLGRPVEAKRPKILLSAPWGHHRIEVRRTYGLTELIVDGLVYGQQQGVIETGYTISAVVDGHTVATSLVGMKQNITVDGALLAEKVRLN